MYWISLHPDALCVAEIVVTKSLKRVNQIVNPIRGGPFGGGRIVHIVTWVNFWGYEPLGDTSSKKEVDKKS